MAIHEIPRVVVSEIRSWKIASITTVISPTVTIQFFLTVSAMIWLRIVRLSRFETAPVLGVVGVAKVVRHVV